MARESGTTGSAESTTAPTSRSASQHAPVRAAARHPGLVGIFPRAPMGAAPTWPIGKTAVIGRLREADVRLSDHTVSRRHAQLERVDGGFRVTDLGSQHRTFVNGRRVDGAGLFAPYGGMLRIGGTLSLVCDDVRQHQNPVRRIAAGFLGLQRDVLGGPVLSRIWEQATHIAELSNPVLIQGETGSGKEAIARLIHAMRKNRGPFVALNVAAIPDGLFESELFGHVRGSFTGATTSRSGAFCEASGGVLFIDEIGDLRMSLQVKLLRALDQMHVRPVGGDRDVPVSTRVVAATSRDLVTACADGSFRSDLYYRLAGIVVQVPPLRERRSDILDLGVAFLAEQHPTLSVSVEAAEALALARWPGNVRELHHALTRAAVAAVCDGCAQILPAHLPGLECCETADEVALDHEAVELAFARSGGNASRAAESLGVSRSTLYNVLKRAGIAPASLRGK